MVLIKSILKEGCQLNFIFFCRLKGISSDYLNRLSIFYKFMSSSPNRLDPNWVTGFCDRSASFSIIVSRRKSNGKWEIRPTFEILIDQQHKAILDKIQIFCPFGPWCR